MVWCPNDTVSQDDRAPKDVVTRGLNLGEAAAGALAKWAEREQEADILMFRWEASLAEQERSVELYPATLMPTIPEGVELEDLRQPTDPEAQGPEQLDDEEETKAHFLATNGARSRTRRRSSSRKERTRATTRLPQNFGERLCVATAT